MDTSLRHFLSRCDDVAKRADISTARLSTIIFGSGVTLDRLRAGKGVTVRVLKRAEDRLVTEEKSRGLDVA